MPPPPGSPPSSALVIPGLDPQFPTKGPDSRGEDDARLLGCDLGSVANTTAPGLPLFFEVLRGLGDYLLLSAEMHPGLPLSAEVHTGLPLSAEVHRELTLSPGVQGRACRGVTGICC